MSARRWPEVRAHVLERIAAGEWPAGARLPTEAEMAAELGCARGTVARALGDLAAAGLLERRRRAGTRVAAAPVARAILHIPVTRHEVEARGARHAHRLLERARSTVPTALAETLGTAAGVRFWHLRTLHFADARPFAYEDRWLNPDVLTDDPPDFAAVSPNEWLVATVPYDTGTLGMAAAGASDIEAALLGVAPGAPILVVERRTRRGAATVTAARIAYAPGYRVETAL